MIGQTLSHFKITAKLGEGGMGEVYRAEDTKLGREVAIKLLPKAVAHDPERLARFEREARVLASLNHTHIAAIYQVEQDGETHFLVMELVEGEDLQGRLGRRALELDDALSMAFQVAQALEAAHEKGVVHRDLKPANVKVTPDGQVKVLDFGLAKALDSTHDSEAGGPSATGGAGAVNLSMSPTLTAQMTEAGVILGTAAYMSPEQARGKPVDKRADVWAFGALLWEMLTAHRLFEGETVTDVIAAVVTKEPDLSILPAAIPPEVERLLIRCLRKDPGQRLPDIAAARLVLQEILTGTTPEPRALAADRDGVARGESGRRGRWVWATAALVGAALAGGALLSRLTDRPFTRQAVRFAAAAPEGWSIDRSSHLPVPSPTGDRVVFIAAQEGGTESTLFVRPLESLTALPLGGTEGANPRGPLVWSPDGGSILFRAGEDIRVLDLAKGTARSLAKLREENRSMASWNNSGTIIFSSGRPNPVIHSVAAAGGAASPLTSLDPSGHEISHFSPQFLPDGNRFLFMVYAGQTESNGLYSASLDDPAERERVVDGSEWTRRQYAAGHLLFVDQGTLFAQPFDLKERRTAGSPLAVVSSVAAYPGSPGLGMFAASGKATLAYLPGSGSSGTQLLWRDREGGLTATLGEPRDYSQISLSPDGRKVALEIQDEQGQYDLWTMDVARGVTTRLTATLEDERDPVWSPDGRSIAYIRRGGESNSLCRKGLQTADSEIVLIESAEEYIPESWSADGKTIMVLNRRNFEGQHSIRALIQEEDGAAFSPEEAAEIQGDSELDEAQISPDGRWLAYVSSESDLTEVYLQPFRREGEKIRVSLDGGGQPKWRGDSLELFFVSRQGMLMAVEVGDDNGRAEVGLPQALFEIDQAQGPGYDDYAVTADGQRFLVKAPAEHVDSRFHIVTNWTALLD